MVHSVYKINKLSCSSVLNLSYVQDIRLQILFIHCNMISNQMIVLSLIKWALGLCPFKCALSQSNSTCFLYHFSILIFLGDNQFKEIQIHTGDRDQDHFTSNGRPVYKHHKRYPYLGWWYREWHYLFIYYLSI